MNNSIIITEYYKILNAIKKRCIDLNIKFDNKGYINNFEENLLDFITNWNEIKLEFEKGDGSELVARENRLPKFRSIYSSAALCVNNFAMIKNEINHKKKINFLDYTGFYNSNFETKLTTGLRGHSPNLDFTLENDLVYIGIESKFTEILTPKLPNEKRYRKNYGNLEPYYKSKKLDYLNGFKENVIKYYIDFSDKIHLDVAQLIKHTLGIINISNLQKKTVLFYVYWEPINWKEFEIYTKHRNEIEAFGIKLNDYISFIPMNYIDYWERFNNQLIFKTQINQIKERYLITVN